MMRYVLLVSLALLAAVAHAEQAGEGDAGGTELLQTRPFCCRENGRPRPPKRRDCKCEEGYTFRRHRCVKGQRPDQEIKAAECTCPDGSEPVETPLGTRPTCNA